MQLSKPGRWAPRSAGGFEPFSCYRGFTRHEGIMDTITRISGSAISFAVSGDRWPIREACAVRVLRGGEK